MRALALWLDVVILVMFLSTATVSIGTLLYENENPIVQRTQDKTAIDVENAIDDVRLIQRGSDILLSLVNIDEYTPYPRRIKINDFPPIILDNDFVANKYLYVSQLYNKGVTLKDKLDWRITNVEYVYNDGEPYIHYTLIE